MTQELTPNTQITQENVECGGCGETDAAKRCIGCLHDFRPALSPPAEGEVWSSNRYGRFFDTNTGHGVRVTRSTPAPVDWERVGPKLVEAIHGEINWLKAVVSVCSDSGVVIGAKHSLRQMRKAAALAAAQPEGL